MNISLCTDYLSYKINSIISIYNLKFTIFIILLITSCLFKNLKKIKVCVCTPGKKENRYIRQFVEHYKNYGVDKIFLYDNNELNGERFEEVINDYIENGLVEIVDFRGYKRAVLIMMIDCYKKNYHNYDWLIFFEIDEFIYLKDYKSIKDYLGNQRFDKCQRIQLNWLFHTDNNLLYYDSRPLKERFPEKERKARGVKNGTSNGIKSILKGHIPRINFYCVHTINHNLKNCDGFGKPAKIIDIVSETSDFEYYYIDHYNFKSTEEFIDKVNKGDGLFEKDNIMDRIRVYFGYNEITKEKLDLMEKETHLNLSEIRKKLKSEYKNKN